jgi:hypothetical protein
MASRHSLLNTQERFSKGLREALRGKYGSVPSAAFVTIQFNRRLNLKNGVSQESVRRWIRGLSMPSYCHLEVLMLWLKLDLAQILGFSTIAESIHYPDDVIRVAEFITRMPSAMRVPLLNFVSSFGSSGGTGGGRFSNSS